jgi:multicomponent Na+:H+ antiporter subunit D
MTGSLPPGLLLMLGALVLPLLRGRLQAAWTVLVPVLGLAHLLTLPEGSWGHLELFDYQLTLVRVDRLSLVFGIIFHLAAVLAAVYAVHVRDTVQHAAGMVYAGSAVAAVFAGDLVTLFVYWEVTAISSVFLIWASRGERAYRAGLRYLVIQVGSGVLLLSGTLLHFLDTRSLAFDQLIGDDGKLASASLGVVLIFLAFGIKCAFPLLHNWLQDAYPEATVTGTVFLSAFTTKLAIYALARGFPGTEVLLVLGVVMTLFPVFFAVIENDLRRVLAYSLNNQLGFMVVGIGVGTELALNGTVAHAFCHILYKALLFMSMGAVLYRAGTIKASELGGLYKSMPFTTVCCLVGAASISAFPLFSGFVSKSLILTAVAEHHYVWIWLGLVIASAGVMEHSGIKIPFFAFFAHDSGIRCKEAPWNMLIAMGVTAALCIFLGCFPGVLYGLLPYAVDYQPYTGGHVLTQLQLLLFATLAFGVLWRTRRYPAETPSVNLDFDWTYRRLLPGLVDSLALAGRRAWAPWKASFARLAAGLAAAVRRWAGPGGLFARTWSTNDVATVIVAVLAGYLLLVLWFGTG